MAMIECSECGAHISNKANICIKCGAPITAVNDVSGLVDSPVLSASQQDAPPSQRVVTTEQTGKKYKGLQLVGVMMILAGTVSCSAHEIAASGILWSLGLVIYFGARIGAWWNHG